MALKDKQKVNRTIVIDISEADYSRFMTDLAFAHEVVDQAYSQYPELFPATMAQGYAFNGQGRLSKKRGLRLRKVKTGGRHYQIRPSFLLSYHRGLVREVYKPLFLLRFGVPFWALALIFGRYAMYWYRLFLSLSDFSLVGTTFFRSALPEDLAADEYHIRIGGKKGYVATTVGAHCFLGAEVTEAANGEALEQGYSAFKQEAKAHCPDYAPETVNIDGWYATQNAWRALFPKVFIIECFLHACIKVRDRATKTLKALYHQAADQAWEIYRAETKRHMGQRIRRLREWAHKQLPETPMRENLIKLCEKKKRWLAHLDFPNAQHTSNMIDRLMKFMDRLAFNAQMFHGSKEQTTKHLRAFALLYNFTPSSPQVVRKTPALVSPAARLNGFCYHENWLQNLLIAASIGGFRHQCKTL